jgi:hypothetical protein
VRFFLDFRTEAGRPNKRSAPRLGTGVPQPQVQPDMNKDVHLRFLSRPLSRLVFIVACALLAGCEGSATLSAEAEFEDPGLNLADAELWILAGSAQEGEVASSLPEPVVVRVTDPDGTPLDGVSIEWVFEHGRGFPTGTDQEPSASFLTTTDANGRTSAQWELGTTSGEQAAYAQIVDPNSMTMRASQTSGPSSPERQLGLAPSHPHRGTCPARPGFRPLGDARAGGR